MAVVINKRILILIAIILGISAVCVSLVINMYKPLPADYFLEQELKVIDKTNFSILFSSKNVTVIDCSLTNTEFVNGHRLPGAIWSTVPSMFYHTDNRLVVYSNDDNRSKEFCFELLRHTNGIDVFLFKGGYPKWNTEE